MFLLDTDHISIVQLQTQPEFSRLAQRLAQQPRSVVYWSIVSFHEQTLGAHAYVNRARMAQGVLVGYEMFRRTLTQYAAGQVLPFDAAAAATFDTLKAQRVRIGTMDLRIASIALSRGMTVLTRNVRDFRQAPGLNVEDWTV
jgi:tRNA(fMet)-specific endonuclease VapC